MQEEEEEEEEKKKKKKKKRKMKTNQKNVFESILVVFRLANVA